MPRSDRVQNTWIDGSVSYHLWCLNSVVSTVFAGQHVATFARQDVLVMSRATYLASHAATRSSKSSELASVIARVICS